MRAGLSKRKKEPSDCSKSHLAQTNEGNTYGDWVFGEMPSSYSPVFSASSCNVNRFQSGQGSRCHDDSVEEKKPCKINVLKPRPLWLSQHVSAFEATDSPLGPTFLLPTYWLVDSKKGRVTEPTTQRRGEWDCVKSGRNTLRFRTD